MLSLERFCIAQIVSIPGAVEKNAQKIIDLIESAKISGFKVIVFPELSLSGYFCLDSMFDHTFLNEQQLALKRIAEHTQGIMALVGFIRLDEACKRAGGRPTLYNSCAVIADLAIAGYQDKVLLPDFDIFNETRYFVSGKEVKIFEFEKTKLGIHICEDMWFSGYQRNPCKELEQLGADILVNLSASPFDFQKEEERERTVRALSTSCPLIYCNLVGAYDGYEGEVLFDGRSFIYHNDSFLYAKNFSEDLFSLKNVSVPKESEIQRIFQGLIFGIKSYFDRSKNQKAIIGLSGGVDSALVLALAVEALGSDNVLAISMPSVFSSEGTKKDAREVAKNLNVKFKEISIINQYEEMLSELKKDKDFDAAPANIAEENLQSRIRMIILLAMSNKLGGLVLNTGNKTELALGYCTVYGDMAGALSVLGDVNKKQVYELCEYYNNVKKSEIIPQSILIRAPSAELAPNQTDAAGMGDDPRNIADVVDELIKGVSVKDIRTSSKFSKFSEKLLVSLEKKIKLNEWKRRQAAPAIRVSVKAFGHGRRVNLG